MNGARLAENLRKTRSKVKIVLFTGNLQVPEPDLSSVDAVIYKSDGVEVLLETVERLLAEPQLPASLLAPGIREWIHDLEALIEDDQLDKKQIDPG